MRCPSHSAVLRLVGGIKVGSTFDLDEYGRLFGRMTKDVPHTGSISRYIGFEGGGDTGARVHFLGIEVEHIQDIPHGMTAWEMDDSSCSVWESRHGVDTIIGHADLEWRWLDRSAGRPVGEFSMTSLPEWNAAGVSSRPDFRMTSNAYVSLQGDSCDDDVHLVDYDPSWPRQFLEIERWIREKMGGDLALRVEHYGSTAIPGIPAKPIIDILVEIPSFDEARERAIPLLNCPEWEYWWYSDHMVFIRRTELMGRRTHHIHMATANHEIWKGLAFRDHLRSHSEDASRYADLKRELAHSYRTDRERYTIAKTAFVQEITTRAAGAD